MNDGLNETENTIIGWGLAGAVLAWQLHFRGVDFQVYDSTVNHSTRVAAGLVNPVVFKRLTKSWNADVLLPFADSFYAQIEKELGVQLLSRKNIWRVFASVEEENNWSSKMGDDRFSAYLGVVAEADLPPQNKVLAPFGMGEVHTLGNLDTNVFLDASKSFFQTKGVQFFNHKFNYSTLEGQRRYFCCEGSGLINNPFFKDLPLNPTHGETLIIETDALDVDQTLNKNMFLMRLDERHYKVGATYNWELTEPLLTEEAKGELVEKLETFTHFNYTVVAHQAGLRPTVRDRRPLLGAHAEQKNVVLFNGLGAKGVMIGPYYANALLNHVFDGEILDKEVDIRRFERLGNKS